MATPPVQFHTVETTRPEGAFGVGGEVTDVAKLFPHDVVAP